MARITVQVGTRERLAPTILKATPMGALGTEAVVGLGPGLELRGPAAAMRALADACNDAALMAEQWAQDHPDPNTERG